LQQGDLERVAAVGPTAPREFAAPLASGDGVAPVIAPSFGGVQRIADGLPDLRAIRAGRTAFGRGWIGMTPRGAYETVGLQVTPLLPSWGWLILAALTAIGGWVIEGRRAVTARAK
jgi:hypothetical protein